MTPKYGNDTPKLTRRGNILSVNSSSVIASFVGPNSRPQVPDTSPPMPSTSKIRSTPLVFSPLPLHRIVKPSPHSAPLIAHWHSSSLLSTKILSLPWLMLLNSEFNSKISNPSQVFDGPYWTQALMMAMRIQAYPLQTQSQTWPP